MIDESVRVGAVFNNNRITPKWFIRKNQHFNITAVNYTWKTRQGKDTIHHFAVSDGINVFELSYYPEESRWELTAVDQAQ